MSQPSYSLHYETLTAVVTHLAVNKWALRQPQGIANDLSIDVADVKVVLKEFKGMFRESVKKSKDHSDHFYSLHLRHSRQAIDEKEVERPPLDSEYLIPLLEFISKKSIQEAQHKTAITVALTGASLTLVASAVSLLIAFYK